MSLKHGMGSARWAGISSLGVLLSTVGLTAVLTGQAAAKDACDGLSASVLPGVTIAEMRTRIELETSTLPRHCVVTGRINERIGLDNKTYAIQFEMRLPENWNGRFLHQMNGGNEGVVVPAFGDRTDAPISGGILPLRQGFAVLSSDGGHARDNPANASAGLAAGAVFGMDPRARRDYGYGTTESLAPLGKALIAAFYGVAPRYSYIVGCSNGGRHVMVAADRMPDHYDGFLAGNPGFDLPRAALQHAWDVQAFTAINPDLRQSISRADAALVSRKITGVCDALDGLTDGLTTNIKACQQKFSFDALTCAPDQTAECLSPTKVAMLKKSFSGPTTRNGKNLYSDWPVDGGVGTGNWRAWKVESAVAAWNNFPIIATQGAASLAYIFSTPPNPVEGKVEALVEFLKSFDVEKNSSIINAVTKDFEESAMGFMAPPSVDNPHLAELAKLKRKMIIYHGQADPVFSFNSTARWYETLDKNNQSRASDFARLFAVPGITHCGGGVGLGAFDALAALTEWVEQGRAPETITASREPANKELPGDWSPNRTRPLCPWPRYAAYKAGDPEQAASFECIAP